MKQTFVTFALFGLLLGVSGNGFAQSETTLLAPGSMRVTMNKILTNYESKTGNKVKVTYAGGLTTRASVAKGEAGDLTLVIPPYWAALASGNIDRSTITTVASCILAVVVPHGAPKPDISSPAAVKKAFLAASSIGYSDPDFSSSGVAVTKVIEKLGVNDQIVAKSKVAMSDATTRKDLNSGSLALAMLYVSDIHAPADQFDIVGVLPRKVSAPNPILGFVTTHAKNPEGAKAFLQFLISPESQAIFKADGFEPHS